MLQGMPENFPSDSHELARPSGRYEPRQHSTRRPACNANRLQQLELFRRSQGLQLHWRQLLGGLLSICLQILRRRCTSRINDYVQIACQLLQLPCLSPQDEQCTRGGPESSCGHLCVQPTLFFRRWVWLLRCASVAARSSLRLLMALDTSCTRKRRLTRMQQRMLRRALRRIVPRQQGCVPPLQPYLLLFEALQSAALLWRLLWSSCARMRTFTCGSAGMRHVHAALWQWRHRWSWRQ